MTLQHTSLEIRKADVEAELRFWALLGFDHVETPSGLNGRATCLTADCVVPSSRASSHCRSSAWVRILRIRAPRAALSRSCIPDPARSAPAPVRRCRGVREGGI